MFLNIERVNQLFKMKGYLKFIFSASLVFILTGCITDGDGCETPSEKGLIEVKTEWPGIDEGIIPPVNNVHLISSELRSDEMYTIEGKDDFLPEQPRGRYDIYVYNTANQIQVSGNIASVDVVNTNRADETIAAHPGWFFSYRGQVSVIPDKTVIVEAVMKQQVRELTFVFDVIEEGNLSLAGCTARLDGVARTLDMNTNAVGNPSSVIPVFTKEGNKLSASVYLLGVIENNQQLLMLDLQFTDGTHHIVQFDISDQLKGFNSNKETPMVWEADLVITSSAGIGASITNWVDKTGTIIL